MSAAARIAETPLPHERRRSARRPFVCDAWLKTHNSDEADEAEIASLNLSRHGVAFEIDRPLDPGTFYFIEIAMGETTLVNEVRIASCVAAGDGMYHVGAEFC
jgi:hypothetical protein